MCLQKGPERGFFIIEEDSDNQINILYRGYPL